MKKKYISRKPVAMRSLLRKILLSMKKEGKIDAFCFKKSLNSFPYVSIYYISPLRGKVELRISFIHSTYITQSGFAYNASMQLFDREQLLFSTFTPRQLHSMILQCIDWRIEGMKREMRSELILRKLVDRKIIKDIRSASLEENTIKGIDYFVTLNDGLEIPLNTKSSDAGVMHGNQRYGNVFNFKIEDTYFLSKNKKKFEKVFLVALDGFSKTHLLKAT